MNLRNLFQGLVFASALAMLGAKAAAPIVTTLGASNVTATAATLYGTVNPNGANATAWFAYAPTGQTFIKTLSTSNISVTTTISSTVSLNPATTYQFQFIGTNSAGSNSGGIVTFISSNTAPSVTTLVATAISYTFATLNGSVSPNGRPTTSWFQYGLTTSYGSLTPTTNLAGTNISLAVSNFVVLSPGTNYHYRIVATNNLGTNSGGDQVFQTLSFPQALVLTGASTNNGGGIFSLSGSVNPEGSAGLGWLNWGPSASYGSVTPTRPLGNGFTYTNFNEQVTGIVAGVVYHYRAACSNGGGFVFGQDATFHIAGTVAVTNLADSGSGSLREAIQGAYAGDTITVTNQGIIALSSGGLLITNSLTLIGPGATNLSITGNQANRIFNISGGGVEVAPMAAVHDSHTATLLSDGTLLIVGGPSYSFAVAEPETYSTNFGGAGVGGPRPRFGHTATPLTNGSVLVTGGTDSSTFAFDSGQTATFYLDPAWTNNSPLNVPRFNHSATLLTNGTVLAAGGVTADGLAALASAELFYPAAGNWTNTGSLNTPRESHTASILANGSVLVIGGTGSTGSLASVEIYNPTSGAWTSANPLTKARYNHTATILTNGMVLVVGGLDASGPLVGAEIFNPTTGVWTNTGSLFVPRFHHTTTRLPNGKVLVAGGSDSSGPVGSVELYDPVSGTWTLTPSLLIARESHTATLLSDGSILIAGGSGSSGPMNSVERYTPGGGVTVNISAVTIRDGRAPDGASTINSGGAIINAGTLNMTNCVLTGSRAGNGIGAASSSTQAGAGGDGGAINNLGVLNLTGCTLSTNTAGDGGKGSEFIFGSTQISQTGGGKGGNGGAINNSGTLILNACTLSGNRAGAGGDNATAGNGDDGVPGGAGGAIFNSGKFSLTACTMSGNSAGLGGGGGNGGFGGRGGSGGAIYSVGLAIATLRNGLIAQNVAGSGGVDGGGGPGLPGFGPDLCGGFNSLGHNLLGKTDDSLSLVNGINGDIVGTAAAPINPLTGPLLNNGGPTPTIALTSSSPAVNTGDDTLTGTDQRGRPRLSGDHVDIGAVELDLTTSYLAPVVSGLSSGPATNSSSTRLYSATVSASVHPGGLLTSVLVAYGPTTNYGNITTAVSAGAATTNSPVSLLLSGLMPGTIYHYRVVAANAVGIGISADQLIATGLAGDFNGDSLVSQSELDAVYAGYLPTSPWLYITNVSGLGGTNVTFTLSNSLAGAYTVIYSTNLVNWQPLGPAIPRYQFIDSNAPAIPQRYYRLAWP